MAVADNRGEAYRVSTEGSHFLETSFTITDRYLIGASGVFARLMLVGVGVCLASSHLLTNDISVTLYQQVTLGILTVLFACSIGVTLLDRRGLIPWRSVYVHLCLDALIITGVVWLTGGAQSPFPMLYLPLVMLGALTLTPRYALILAAMVGGMYCVLIAMLFIGLLPSLGDQTAASLSMRDWFQFVVILAGIGSVAWASSFLTHRLHSTTELVRSSLRQIEDLASRQVQLMNEISDGVVATDLQGRITSMNQVASQVLNVRPEAAQGRFLSEISKQRFPSQDLLRSFEEGRTEVHLHSQDGIERRHVLCYHRDLGVGPGGVEGRIYIFRDVTRIRSIEEQLEMQERMAKLLANSNHDYGAVHTKVRDFVGKSSVMQQVFKLIARVAPSDATTLISGESGTGKELVAKAIHLGGTRSLKPFVPVNCGAIPESLIESQLFGHKKGAFTGAVSDHLGYFVEAQGGTLFLDEVGELPLQMQAKLLRVLQERSVRPVGGAKDTPIDVRIIAATNKNLKREVQAGRFREDLFFRLNVIQIQLPALRQRKEDLPDLINSILSHLVPDGPLPLIPPATLQLLQAYEYPGNVRELENILERAVVLGGEAILPEHLPDVVRESRDEERSYTEIVEDESIEFPVRLDEILASVERRYLERALDQANGVKKRAADLLGINFRSFRYRLEKFGLHEDEAQG